VVRFEPVMDAPLPLLEVTASDLERYPDALSDVFEARLTGIVIREAFLRQALTAVTERLERGDFGLDSHPSEHFKGKTYGRLLIVGNGELGEYFREAARFRAACARLFAGGPAFETRVEALLTAVAGGREVRVPPGPNGSSYAPATIRGLQEGGQIDLHCENETVDFPSMWHLSRLIHARNQLSFYVVLGLPDAGGELVIHNARFAESSGELLHRMERTGTAAIEAIAPYGQVIPRTEVGDLLVFDSGRHFHRVTAVKGQRMRWTIGGFLARSLDDRAVYHWS
jgi:hypothetical protein